MNKRMIAVLVALLGGLVSVNYMLACPFCSAVKPTFTEEIATMDAVVIAQLDDLRGKKGESSGLLSDPDFSRARFSIARVLKGKDAIGDLKTFSTVFFGDAKKGDRFLVMGVDPPNLNWSTPLKLNDRQYKYLLALMKVPEKGPERLEFFQAYLENKDSMLSGDAYDEFARAPYKAVKALKPKMDHDQLVAWIKDPNVPASRRRLYLTMLGVCGTSADIPMLEQRLRGTDSQTKSALDALIACYLTLRGPEGVSLIEDLYIKQRDDNFSGNYADIYNAIMALRFHGTEGDIVPRERVLKSFALVLETPQMADLIIPDLARWEDWRHVKRLVKMFKTADVKTTYVRSPIANYVRACPLPEAKAALKELEKIDPETMERSKLWFRPPTKAAAKKSG